MPILLAHSSSAASFLISHGNGERLVMNRKGSWKGYRRQAKPVLSFRLPFPAHFHGERDVWVRGSITRVLGVGMPKTRGCHISV